MFARNGAIKVILMPAPSAEEVIVHLVVAMFGCFVVLATIEESFGGLRVEEHVCVM